MVPPSLVLKSQPDERPMPAPEAVVPNDRTRSILERAAGGLAQMFLPEKQLFCYTLRREPDGQLRSHGTSHRYTMMTLLGLHRYERAGHRSPIALGPVLDALLRDTAWIQGVGDLGLLLWLCAELMPERLPEVYEAVNPRNARAAFVDVGRAKPWSLPGS